MTDYRFKLILIAIKITLIIFSLALMKNKYFINSYRKKIQPGGKSDWCCDFPTSYSLFLGGNKGNGESKKILDKYDRNNLPNIRKIVANLDKITTTNKYTNKTETRNFSKRNTLHFVFIGDSRIRQHFLNILKIFPDYDLKFEPRFLSSYDIRDYMHVASNILNFRISFFFRRWLTSDTTDVFLQLLNNFHNTTHRVILVGITLHHMLNGNGTVNFEQYQANLTALKPMLNHTTTKSSVIWLNQYPTIDSFDTLNGQPEIFSEKIHHYNSATENILKNTGVKWWNSGNILVEEYIRSCFLHERSDNWIRKPFGHSYFYCFDYVHPGYVVMGEMIKLFLLDFSNMEGIDK